LRGTDYVFFSRGVVFLKKLTLEKFEQLILQTLDELRLSGHIVATVAVHEDPAVLCSTVSTQNGQKHVHIDFHVHADEDSVLREIRQQFTRTDNASPAKDTSMDLSGSSADSTKLYDWTKAMNSNEHKIKETEAADDDAARQAKREAKVEALKAKAREIVERVRLEERRKRGKPKK
jgi:hypothetical protein